MLLFLLRLINSLVRLSFPSVNPVVRPQCDPIFPPIDAQPIGIIIDARKVDEHNHRVALAVSALKSDHVFVRFIRRDPFKPIPRIFDLVKSRRIEIEAIQIPIIPLQFSVRFKIRQEKLQSLAVIPFLELPVFAAHKQELFPGMRHHKSHKRPEIGELLRVVSRHLVQQRTLPVHHFVVGNGENKIFAERIHHGKRQLIVLIAPEIRIGLHIGEDIVHPPHVPLEIEPQTAHRNGLRHHRKRRGFLRDHHGVRKTLE